MRSIVYLPVLECLLCAPGRTEAARIWFSAENQQERRETGGLVYWLPAIRQLGSRLRGTNVERITQRRRPRSEGGIYKRLLITLHLYKCVSLLLLHICLIPFSSSHTPPPPPSRTVAEIRGLPQSSKSRVNVGSRGVTLSNTRDGWRSLILPESRRWIR